MDMGSERKNVAFQYRWAEGDYDRLPGLSADLVQRKLAVIVTFGGDVAALAAKGATSTIPIVFMNGSDPVATTSHPRNRSSFVGLCTSRSANLWNVNTSPASITSLSSANGTCTLCSAPMRCITTLPEHTCH
jgi:hypothetical protein